MEINSTTVPNACVSVLKLHKDQCVLEHATIEVGGKTTYYLQSTSNKFWAEGETVKENAEFAGATWARIEKIQ